MKRPLVAPELQRRTAAPAAPDLGPDRSRPTRRMRGMQHHLVEYAPGPFSRANYHAASTPNVRRESREADWRLSAHAEAMSLLIVEIVITTTMRIAAVD